MYVYVYACACADDWNNGMAIVSSGYDVPTFTNHVTCHLGEEFLIVVSKA